ncbi:MAG: FMN-binding protein [Planctomycetales bacterium]
MMTALSRGVAAEIRIARELRIPVRFLDPAGVAGDATGSPTAAHVAKEGEVERNLRPTRERLDVGDVGRSWRGSAGYPPRPASRATASACRSANSISSSVAGRIVRMRTGGPGSSSRSAASPWARASRSSAASTKAWDRIEKLLESANENDRRQAIKLAYVYDSAGKAKEGYPATVYYLAGEYAWALKEFLKNPNKTMADHRRIAACYLHFDAYDEALAALDQAQQSVPNTPPWNTFGQAQILEARGDVLADKGDVAEARKAFLAAVGLYQQSQLPANQQRNVARGVRSAQAKLDMLDRSALESAQLRDGVFTDAVFGYSDQVQARVTVRGGKITAIGLQHKEKADLGAKEVIPKRIVEKQSVAVDAVTGATITSDAIRLATYGALKKSAGLPAQ